MSAETAAAGVARHPMSDAARYRQGLYRLLAAAFAYPTPKGIAAAAEAASHLTGMGSVAEGLSLYGRAASFQRAFAALGPADVPELQARYLLLFGDSGGGATISLHESAFVDPGGMEAGWILGDIEAAYGAAGVRAGTTGDRRPDHISVELEFLSHLCGTEAAGWEAGDSRAARRAINLQARFIARHPGVWSHALTRAICDGDPDFYGIAGATVDAVLGHDTDFLPAVKEWIKDVADDAA